MTEEQRMIAIQASKNKQKINTSWEVKNKIKFIINILAPDNYDKKISEIETLIFSDAKPEKPIKEDVM